MKNFFKGIIGGIGNIIPGLSGSALLLCFNIYHQSITAICELIKGQNIKKNILFLLPIALGIGLGTVLFANVIKFFLDCFPFVTSALFFGFILGTLPGLFKMARVTKIKKSHIISFLIPFIFGFSLLILAKGEYYQITQINLFQRIILGFLLAASTIIPGISGTVILSILGFYDVYLNAVAKLDILFLIPVGISFIIGAIFFAFLLNYLFKKYYSHTMYAIIGFIAATIPGILRDAPSSFFVLGFSICLCFIAFFLTHKLIRS